jgi:hypothetical protein
MVVPFRRRGQLAERGTLGACRARVSRLAPPCIPRRPQGTVLFGLVREHVQDSFRHACEAYAGPLPKYVKEEFRKYLAYGDFSHGFVHVQCRTCRHEMAVAFSCRASWYPKGYELRGSCPSCAGRRMAGTAAYLVDGVLPAAPVRQYELAFPAVRPGSDAARRPSRALAPLLGGAATPLHALGQARGVREGACEYGGCDRRASGWGEPQRARLPRRSSRSALARALRVERSERSHADTTKPRAIDVARGLGMPARVGGGWQLTAPCRRP